MPETGRELLRDCNAGASASPAEGCRSMMGGSWLGCGCAVLLLVKDNCDNCVSCEPDKLDEIECAFGSGTVCGINASQGTCGSVPAPGKYATDGPSRASRSGE